MATHDAIAQKDFYPHLPDIPIEVDEDEETVKIVQLVKSNEPLVCKTNLNKKILFKNIFRHQHHSSSNHQIFILKYASILFVDSYSIHIVFGFYFGLLSFQFVEI